MKPCTPGTSTTDLPPITATVIQSGIDEDTLPITRVEPSPYHKCSMQRYPFQHVPPSDVDIGAYIAQRVVAAFWRGVALGFGAAVVIVAAGFLGAL